MSGWRAIFKYMPQMCVTVGAQNLGSLHAVTCIGLYLDALILNGIPEARPTRSRLKFFLGMEQVSSAANALEDSIFVSIPVLAGESAFGAAVPGHLVLLRG